MLSGFVLYPRWVPLLKPLLIIYPQLRTYIFVRGFRRAYQRKGLYLREFITEIKKPPRESRYDDADQNTDSSSFQYIWRGWSGEGGGAGGLYPWDLHSDVIFLFAERFAYNWRGVISGGRRLI